jgi:hypothetical protein
VEQIHLTNGWIIVVDDYEVSHKQKTRTNRRNREEVNFVNGWKFGWSTR